MAAAATSSTPDATRFMQPALVVCDDGTCERLLPLPLQFDATLEPSLLFSFRIPAPSRAPCLQIPPDCLSSMSRTVYRVAQFVDVPPCFDLVRDQLARSENIACIRFELSSFGRVVQSAEDTLDDPRNTGDNVDLPDPDALQATTSLAAASAISVYLPNRKLPRATYNSLFLAARPFFSSTRRPAGTISAHQSKVIDTPPAYAPDDEGRTSQLVDSDNDTVAVSTPRGFRRPGEDKVPVSPNAGEGESCTYAAAAVDSTRKRQTRSSSREGSDAAGGKKRSRRWSPGADLLIDTESPTPSVTLDPVSRLDALEAHIRLLDQRSQGLVTENRDLHNRVRTLEADNRMLQCQIATLGTKHDALQHQVATLETDTRQAQAQHGKLARRVDDGDKQVALMEDCMPAWDRLENRIDALTERHEDLDCNVDVLNSEHNELDDDHHNLRAWVEDMEQGLERRVREACQETVDDYREEMKEKLLAVLDND